MPPSARHRTAGSSVRVACGSDSSGSARWALPMTRHLLAAGPRRHGRVAQPAADRRGGRRRRARRRRSARASSPRARSRSCACPTRPMSSQVSTTRSPRSARARSSSTRRRSIPQVERAQHERVAATGAGYLDAPLSGGTVGAEQRHAHGDGRRRRGRPRRGPARARTVRGPDRARRRSRLRPDREALQPTRLRGADARGRGGVRRSR